MSRMRARALVCVAVAGLAVGRARAASDHTDDGVGVGETSQDVITSWGVDINTLYDYDGYVVTPLGLRHSTIPAGALWAPAFDGWHANTSYSDVYLKALRKVDPTFAPAGDPIVDFERKLVAVTFIVDAGTDQEARFVEDPNDVLCKAISADEFAGIADDDPLGVSSEPARYVPDGINAIVAAEPTFPNDAFFPYLGPLSIGVHTIEVVWTMSADDWDGITTDPAVSELKAGDNVVLWFPIEVVSQDP